jgi:hypothetical protein
MLCGSLDAFIVELQALGFSGRTQIDHPPPQKRSPIRGLRHRVLQNIATPHYSDTRSTLYTSLKLFPLNKCSTRLRLANEYQTTHE